MYRAHGRQKRHTLGTTPPMGLADARDAARRHLLAIQTAEADPAAAKRARRTARTFAQLATLYLDEHARPSKRTWRQDARQLRTFCLPRWQHEPADSVTRADVRELLTATLRTRGGTSANRLRALLSKLFRWAVAQGYLESNPTADLPKPMREQARERVLTDDEIRAVWRRLQVLEARGLADRDADETLSPTVALWLRLRLLTAQRGSSVTAMRWRDVDLEARTWDVPAAHMKAGRPHVVPLSPWVCALLEAQRLTCPPDAVFVLAGGRARRCRLGVEALIGLEDFQLKDLRRTAATAMARAGISRFIITRVLGHVDRSITGVYDRFEYLEEKRAALDAWAARVRAIVEA
jgi:integrase